MEYFNWLPFILVPVGFAACFFLDSLTLCAKLAGYLHSNPLCDVVPRSLNNINKVAQDNVGIGQVISSLPTSYPGHSLLTEDLIEVNNTTKCTCGRYGTSFKVLGRIKTAEKRGCSDTYES